ncbi:hypothetical protein S245_004489, partial [Arachis hypogaea]
RFISAIFDANGTDAILSFEKFCCNLPRPLLQVPDKVPAFSPKKAKSFIESELGASISLLFREFEDRPIAATSLGQLMKPELFDFIDKYNLQDSIHEKVVQLMMLDCKHVVPLLIQHRDLISPQEVVKQLLNADVKCDCRYFLHLYLHSLFEVNPHAGKDFHDIHVWEIR